MFLKTFAAVALAAVSLVPIITALPVEVVDRDANCRCLDPEGAPQDCCNVSKRLVPLTELITISAVPVAIDSRAAEPGESMCDCFDPASEDTTCCGDLTKRLPQSNDVVVRKTAPGESMCDCVDPTAQDPNDCCDKAISKRQLTQNQAACGAQYDSSSNQITWTVDIIVAYQEGEGCNYIHDKLASWGVGFAAEENWSCIGIDEDAGTELYFTTVSGDVAPEINNALSEIYYMVTDWDPQCMQPSGSAKSRSLSTETNIEKRVESASYMQKRNATYTCDGAIINGTNQVDWFVIVPVDYNNGAGCNSIWNTLAAIDDVQLFSSPADLWVCNPDSDGAGTLLEFTTGLGTTETQQQDPVGGVLSVIYPQVVGGINCTYYNPWLS